MLIKGLIDEDFANYRKPSMFIIFPNCSFKCDREAGCSICQNSNLTHELDINIDSLAIVQRYLNNPITKAIVFGGLEPFDSFSDLFSLIVKFRAYTEDDIVIYTGYTEEEIINGYSSFGNQNCLARKDAYKIFQENFSNIIIKFGRFVPNQEPHYDEVLGVKLASNNQYARRIS